MLTIEMTTKYMERRVVPSLIDIDKMAKRSFQANTLLNSNSSTGSNEDFVKFYNELYKNYNTQLFDIPVYSNFHSKSKWHSLFRGKTKKLKEDLKETQVSNETNKICNNSQWSITKEENYKESKLIGSVISCSDKSTMTILRADCCDVCCPYNLASHKINDDELEKNQNKSKQELKNNNEHQNYKSRYKDDAKESGNTLADDEKIIRVVTSEDSTDSNKDSEQVKNQNRLEETQSAGVCTKFRNKVISKSPEKWSQECDKNYYVMHKKIDRIPHGHYTHSKYHANCGFQDHIMYKENIEPFSNSLVRKKLNCVDECHVCNKILPNINKIKLPKRVLTSDI